MPLSAEDFLPDAALDKIEALVPKVLTDFELGYQSFNPNTIQVTFHRPGALALIDQAPVDNLCQAAMCVDTLCKNLRAARSVLTDVALVALRLSQGLHPDRVEVELLELAPAILNALGEPTG